jgi:predicted nuclease of predicted toxin-antitoxin system
LKLRWLADECVDAGIVASLRAHGHDVLYTAEDFAGVSDETVVALANGQNRLLLTEDKDFGELIFRRFRKVPGLVLVRIETAMTHAKWSRVQAAVDRPGVDLVGRYTVVETDKIRSRPLPKSG